MMTKSKKIMIVLQIVSLLLYLYFTSDYGIIFVKSIMSSGNTNENINILEAYVSIFGTLLIYLVATIKYAFIFILSCIGIGISRIYEDKKRKIYFICLMLLSILTLIAFYIFFIKAL